MFVIVSSQKIWKIQMKKLFKAFHKPDDDEFKKLWDSCIFIVDTNVLLNLYRYSLGTSNELLKILENFKNRLWLPYQAGFEFYQNRIKVILELHDAYEKLIKEIDTLDIQFQNTLDQNYSRHPSIATKDIKVKINETVESIKSDLKTKKDSHPDLIKNDKILSKINDLFDERVGEPYSDVDLRDLYKKGEARFSEKIAPGYEDSKKEGNKKYGDFIIWSQIIKQAKITKKNVIFITDDRKDDWWLRVNGKTIGPKPELIAEINAEAGVDFYMYQSDPFIEFAAKYLKSDINKDEIRTAIKEIRDIRKDDESKSLSEYIWPKEIDLALSLQKELDNLNYKKHLENFHYKKDLEHFFNKNTNYFKNFVDQEKYKDLINNNEIALKDIFQIEQYLSRNRLLGGLETAIDRDKNLKLAELLKGKPLISDSDNNDTDNINR